MEISTSQLGTVYKTFSLSYSYSSVAGEDSGTSGEYIPPPGLDWIPFDAPANQDWIDFTKKVRFKVQWLANAEVIVDYIEVYDQEIWEFYFKQNPDWMVDSISNYIDDFSTLGSKLKYVFTMDEPHSWDSFIPIKKIQDILTDTLNTDRELLVHFYPGWNNSRESMSVLDRWMDIAEPSQLNFWYAPFTNDENGIPHKREFTLSSLQGILQVAHEEQPKFFVTLQTFGVKNKDTGEYIHYMHPTEGEVRAETMLSLAHGVRGIYYEEYYSRPSVSPLLVENLVYGMDSSYSPMPLWYVVQDIASRLDGKLGSTLLSLDYTGNYLQLQYFIPSDDPVPTPPTYDYLTLGQNPSAEDMNWHAGLFVNSSHSDNKYFLLTNLLTTANKSVQVKVTEPVSGYDNYRFRNVEDGYFDTTFVTQIIKTLTHPKGEGYLYQVAPVVKYGGKLIANDTVDASINLVDDMIIRNGVNLLIDDGGYYTAEDTITLQGTGFITGDGYFDRDEYGWVVLNSWDYSVFKGRVGDHPKIIWSEHPTIQNIHSYRIYRDKGTSGWVPIKILPDSIFEYIDSTVTIVTGPPSQNEVTAYYFVAARIEEKEQIVNADSSNSILYRRVEGAGWEKRGTGEKGVRFTYSLGHNYPNPYNPSTTINYSLERSGLVELDVFDILGSRVALLVNEHREEGHHSVVFNATNLSSGIYFYRIKSGGFVQTKKMILIK
jgi:hypothetical protein